MGFDFGKGNLNKLAEAGYEFELVYPATDEPTGAFITVRGDKSPVVQAYDRQMINQTMLQSKQKQKKNQPDEAPTIEDYIEKACKRAAVKTIGWRGILVDGEEVAFTTEAAEKFYLANDWVREAVESESNDLSNFRPK